MSTEPITFGKADARHKYLEASKDIKDRATPVLRYLSSGFSVTWFRQVSPQIWQAILKPNQAVQEKFGLHFEYFLIGNNFSNDFHMRTMLTEPPRGVGYRIDGQLRFVVSDAPGMQDACAVWARDRGISIIPLSPSELAGSSDSDLTATLTRSLSVRDRFDDSEPVRTPGEFFGREPVVSALVSRIIEGRPTAIFGLRKIGKSSLLQRVEDRLAANENYVICTSFHACNSTEIKAGHWYDLLLAILRAWAKEVADNAQRFESKIQLAKHDRLAKLIGEGQKLSDDAAIARAFQRDFEALLKTAGALCEQNGKIAPRFVAILDEADHLYPHLPSPGYWITDFFHFWNTLQGTKRSLEDPRTLSYLIGGVNPSGIESGSLTGHPNPLFEMSTKYLKPMSSIEADELLNGLGRSMGLSFSADAVQALYQFTGGHPWLLRRAGSLAHEQHEDRSGPLDITKRDVQSLVRRSKQKFYAHVDWILRHLQTIAPDEYRLLVDVCRHGVDTYNADWADNDFRDVFAAHLEDYGLLHFDDDNNPRITIELVRDAVSRPTASTFESQHKELREAADTLETAMRRRLAADLGSGLELHEAVDLIVKSIPGDAKSRPEGREGLRKKGISFGLRTLLESLNWEDYLVLVEKFYERIRWVGAPITAQDFLPELRETVRLIHLARHNNDSELRNVIGNVGYRRLLDRIHVTSERFSS